MGLSTLATAAGSFVFVLMTSQMGVILSSMWTNLCAAVMCERGGTLFEKGVVFV
jgi:hypothetical protein